MNYALNIVDQRTHYIFLLTHVLLNCLWVFFIHLKLESLTQFPASNEWKIILLKKSRHLSNWIIWLTEHPPQDILQIIVVVELISNVLENVYARADLWNCFVICPKDQSFHFESIACIMWNTFCCIFKNHNFVLSGSKGGICHFSSP